MSSHPNELQGNEDTLPLVGVASTTVSVLEAPTAIGPYRILQLVGEGGMGEVWLAEQVEPIRRRVAVKVIKVGMDTKQVVARFESERQALALMNHPAIARVFDAGSTPEGRPYFVMEYVAGVTLTEHCDTHRLSTVARLQLFSEVCEGVQHAHQKAIIHRDLKPSNILVTLENGPPQAKIIDFGVAKAIGLRLTETTLHTEIGSVIGTPEYMSPEQADLTGQDVDTRTDVYSLGVILYQLLTGELPFDSGELRASSYEEMRRKLREVEPPKPSTKISTLGDSGPDVASHRRTDPSALRRQLEGDLDAITMKALEKDRARRYGTPSELAADIGRHLRSEPVLARSPSRIYRTKKYVRRHRLGVAIATTLTFLLIGFGAAMAFQAQRVSRERDRANREARSSKRISDFMVGMFRVSSPSEARGNSVTAREILDKASKNIDASLTNDPDVQARMQFTMGDVYKNLGLFQQAEKLLGHAFKTQTGLLGIEHPDTLDTGFRLAETMFFQGHFSQAEALLRDVLSGQRRVLGAENPATLRTMNMLANLLSREERIPEAEALMRETLALQRKVLGPEDQQTLASTSHLAGMLEDEGKIPEAEQMYRQALEGQRRVLGKDHPDTLASMSELASLLMDRGQLSEAETLARSTLEGSRRVIGPEHINTLVAMEVLGGILTKEGHLAEAEALGRETLQLRARALGPEHPDTVHGMASLGDVLASEGMLPEAERLHRQALEIDSRVLGPESSQTALVKVELARDLAMSGRTAEALGLLQGAVAHGLPGDVAIKLADDNSLKSLRDQPGFEALLARIRASPPP
jgi:serine/threonine protein kinase